MYKRQGTASPVACGDPSLNTLHCYNNQITVLDVSQSIYLTHLDCRSNQLTSLDLSAQVGLTIMKCNNNDLTYLNLRNGNNANMPAAFCTAHTNPNLMTILVDDASYSQSSWPISTCGWNAGAEFCDASGVCLPAI